MGPFSVIKVLADPRKWARFRLTKQGPLWNKDHSPISVDAALLRLVKAGKVSTPILLFPIVSDIAGQVM